MYNFLHLIVYSTIVTIIMTNHPLSAGHASGMNDCRVLDPLRMRIFAGNRNIRNSHS